MSYIYLASPYSSTVEQERLDRFHAAEHANAWLMQRLLWAYSPIVHCHELARKYQLPTDFGFWRDYNFAMIRGASKFYILDIPGWQASKGVRTELRFAQDLPNIKEIKRLQPHHEDYVFTEL